MLLMRLWHDFSHRCTRRILRSLLVESLFNTRLHWLTQHSTGTQFRFKVERFSPPLTQQLAFHFQQQRHPPLLLGWMFLVLPFLPASNLFITVGFVVAERVLYMPSVGWILLVVYGMQISWTAIPRRRSLITMGIVLLLLLGCYKTVLRNRDWMSRESLIRAGLRSLPHNAKMHYNFANFLRDTSQPNRAILHYQLALWWVSRENLVRRLRRCDSISCYEFYYFQPDAFDGNF